MTEDLRVFLGTVKQELTIQSRKVLSEGSDRKVVEAIANYIHKKIRSDLKVGRDRYEQ